MRASRAARRYDAYATKFARVAYDARLLSAYAATPLALCARRLRCAPLIKPMICEARDDARCFAVARVIARMPRARARVDDKAARSGLR